MRRAVRVAAAVVGVTVMAGCAGHMFHSHQSTDLQPDVVPVSGGGTVITSAVLQKENRSLLDVMKSRLPFMTVFDSIPCPEVYLRGPSTIASPSNPAIYVDAQRATNTCVLEDLSSIDIDHVEIYPSGVSPRPGYLNDPYGLVIIFIRTSN